MGGNTNRGSFSGASVCIFLKLNFIYLSIRVKIQENRVCSVCLRFVTASI